MSFHHFKPSQLPFTYQGYEFYEADGKVCFRRSYQRPSGDDLRYNEAFANVRKSNTEFAYIAEINRHFRLALAPLFRISIPYFHSYVQQLFVKLNQFDLKHDLGHKRLDEALKHPEFYKVFKEFNFSPNAGSWVEALQPGLRFNSSQGCLELLPNLVNYDLLFECVRLDFVIGEVIFDFKTHSFTSNFQQRSVAIHDLEGFTFYPRFETPEAPKLHFIVYSVFAVPDYDYTRKRSKQTEPLLYVNLIVL
ncbi:MAG: hypothetical protein R6V36_04640 [Psychroflexus sp.]